MNDKMYFVMEMIGVFLLSYFAFSEMAFFEKLFGLLGSLFLFGYPISMNRNERKEYEIGCGSIKLKDLSPATCVIVENPYIPVCGKVEDLLFQYFMLVECNRSVVVVEMPKDKDNRYKLQVAMNKYIEEIDAGEAFKIHKNHSITRLGT